MNIQSDWMYIASIACVLYYVFIYLYYTDPFFYINLGRA